MIIDGKQVAADVRADVAKKVSELKSKGINPCLAVILVGENPASVSYVTGKQKALAEHSVRAFLYVIFILRKPSGSFHRSAVQLLLRLQTKAHQGEVRTRYRPRIRQARKFPKL